MPTRPTRRSRMVGAAFALVLALPLALATAATARAETFATWDPVGTLDGTSPLIPSFVSPDIDSAGTLNRSASIVAGGSFANAFMGDNWPAGALDTGAYMAFSVAGDDLAYETVAFSLYNNFDGTGSWQIRSSVDGFAAPLASGTFSDISFDGENITADISALGTVTGNVEFRLYTYDNAGATSPLQRGIRGSGGAAPGIGLSVTGTAAGGPVVVTPAQPVPTLAPASLAALAALLAAAAALKRRRATRMR